MGKLSSRLKALVDKEFPDYDPIIEEFEKMIVWKKASGRRIPEPKPGVDENFDKCNEDVIEMKEKLQEYIVEVAEEHKLDDDDLKLIADKTHRYLIKVDKGITLGEDFD